MTLLTDSRPVARKSHRCQVCGTEIVKGQRHLYQTVAFDGSVYPWRSHIDCADMHWHHNKGRDSDDQCDDYYLDEYRGFWPHAVCRCELSNRRRDERRKIAKQGEK